MLHWFINIFLMGLSVFSMWYAYTQILGVWQLVLMFVAGVFFGIFVMNIKLFVKNDKLNSYKRELEKESIASDESSAKVRVLEAKIEVLEKALDNALNNKS